MKESTKKFKESIAKLKEANDKQIKATKKLQEGCFRLAKAIKNLNESLSKLKLKIKPKQVEKVNSEACEHFGIVNTRKDSVWRCLDCGKELTIREWETLNNVSGALEKFYAPPINRKDLS